MIKTVKIQRWMDGYISAKFDTIMTDGRRAKHYTFRQGEGYIHICRHLEPKDTEPILVNSLLFVSDRVFFGKYRLAERVDYYKPDTWNLISDVVNKLKKVYE